MKISLVDRVENIVRKGNLLVQKTSFPDPSKGVIVWKCVNQFNTDSLSLSLSIPLSLPFLSYLTPNILKYRLFIFFFFE